ncbi:MAG TPA: DUF5329 family protein [Candidatus Binatia bacterium]
MKSLRSLAVALSILALCGGAALAKTQPADEDTRQTIEFLLNYVAGSDMAFIRNGTSYTSKEAVAHLRSKYDYFKAEIQTPEDFIRLAASKSEFSGRPYLVKTRDGKVQNSADWLGAVLNDYRSAQIKAPPASGY